MREGGIELAVQTELLPCPHCGEVEHLYPSYRLKDRASFKLEDKPYAVDCVGCGYDFVPREGLDVIAAWNRRVPPPASETEARATAAEARVAVLEAEIDQLRIAGTILAGALAKPTDHASTAPGPVNCNTILRNQGHAYPRTCERCKLGPCPFYDADGFALGRKA
jgi:hypothetical protein